ncbi:MAG TPA: hypothetical protein IAA29_21255 [Candidatus Paenibacillus intestinavium]|nr:hypothetical protein [Candidatus Paenibacillus intestinavium]
MMIPIMKLLIYSIAIIATFFMTRGMLYLRRRSPPKLSQQLTTAVNRTKPWYQDSKLDLAISDAGLTFMSAWTYKLCRDVIALLMIVALHVQFLMTEQYPVAAIAFIAVIYGLSLSGHSWMPLSLLLNAMKKDRIQKKNDEIVLLFMLFVNDTYTETEDHYQSVISKIKEYRKDMNALRDDLDQLIFEYQMDGQSAFQAFGERVNTKEAKMLSTLLEKINQSNPQTAADLLEQHYETFLDYRRQRRKRQLRANGHIGFSIVFLSIIAVVFLINSISGAYQELLFNDFQ